MNYTTILKVYIFYVTAIYTIYMSIGLICV